MDIPDLSSLNTESLGAAEDRRESAPMARRVVLRAGAALPLGLGLSSLAACGDDEGGAANDTAAEDDSSEDEASQDDQAPEAEGDGSEDSADPEAESQGDSAAGGSGFPTQDVPVGGATYDEPSNTVFSQPTSGEFRAFDAKCPHQGCAVSEFQDGSLLCPCHSSMFDLDTGDVTGGPATSGLTAREVTVEGENLVVS